MKLNAVFVPLNEGYKVNKTALKSIQGQILSNYETVFVECYLNLTSLKKNATIPDERSRGTNKMMNSSSFE